MADNLARLLVRDFQADGVWIFASIIKTKARDPSGEETSRRGLVVCMADQEDEAITSDPKLREERKERSKASNLRLLLALTTLLLLTLTRLLLLLGAGAVHLVEESKGGGLELVGLGLEVLGSGGTLTRLVLGNELTEAGNLLLDLVSLSLVEAVLELLEGLLSVVKNTVGLVGGLNGSLALLVSSTVLLGVVDHGLDLGVAQTRAGSNGDGLVLAGGLVGGVNVDNRIGVNVEGDLDLRDTTVGRRNTNKLEVSEELVVADELTLTLVDLDLDGGLEVSSGGEDLRLLGRNGGVAVDQAGEDTAEGLNTEGKRSDIEKEDVSDLTRENGTLDGGTNGDSLIGVDRLGGITAENALDRGGDLGHTGHTTDENDLLNVLGLHVGVLESLADGLDSAVNQRTDELLKLGTGHLAVDVLGARGIGSDEGKVDVSLGSRRKLNLGLLGGLTDTLDGHAVVGKIDALLVLELLDEVADEGDIEVLTTKVGVTVGRLDLEDTALDLEDGNIESTTTKIVDGDDTVALLLKTVSEGGSSGLVDDTEDVKTRDLTGILGGLSLLVVEVGGNGNDGVLAGLAKERLSSLLHLSEDETTDLRGRVLLALSLEPGIAVGVLDNLVGDLVQVTLDLSILELATDQTLGGEESGVVLAPSLFSMILGAEPSMTATAELVPLLNEETMGDLRADERTEGVARSCREVSNELERDKRKWGILSNKETCSRVASSPRSRHSPPRPSNMLESCPNIVRHDRRRPLVSAITVTVTVLAPIHAPALTLSLHLTPLASELQAYSFLCLGFKRSTKRESMPSSVASHTPAMPDVPNAINALLRHVPNPFLLRRKVTTACRSDPYGSLASSSAHQHLVTIMECAYRTSSALHLFRAQTPVVIHEVAHAEQSFGEAVRDRGDSNSGPRAKVIALDIVRHGLSSSASALVLMVARVA
ncbi:hypothetical protein KCV06_g321, partial [Aureobasidium melanogenum]